MYLVFDIETTGLVKCEKFGVYPDVRNNEMYNTARIVQIAWVVIDENFKIIEEKCYIVKRDNFSIGNSEFHGVSNEISDIKGTRFDIVMLDFNDALNRCSTIVAHNILFDFNVLLNHLFRYDLHNIYQRFINKNKFCTSYESSNVLKIQMPYVCDHYKFPSLQELYKFYFKKNFKNSHNALVDTKACMKCFISLIQDHRYYDQFNS